MNLLDELTAHRLLAIVRGRDADAVTATACRLIDLQVPVVEISLTSAGALRAIEAAARRSAEAGGRSWVGAGTVVSSQDLDAALAAGARFVVTPAMGEGCHDAIRRGLPVLAGALTPTEIVQAWQAGASAVKVFPASAMSPGYVEALHAPLPDIPLVPVGGVDTVSARAYLQQGAVAVGVGGPLIGDAADGGALGALDARVAEFRAAVSP